MTGWETITCLSFRDAVDPVILSEHLDARLCRLNAKVLMPWSKQDGFLLGALDFHAVGFDAGIVFQRLMNDASIESAEGFQLDDIAPSPDFFSRVFRFLHQSVACLGAVTSDVNHGFGCGRVLLKQKSVRDVLQVGQCLSLSSNETARIVGFDIEQNAVLERVFFHRCGEAEQFEDFFQCSFGLRRHVWRGVVIEVADSVISSFLEATSRPELWLVPRADWSSS